jgi:hypothetical protein
MNRSALHLTAMFNGHRGPTGTFMVTGCFCKADTYAATCLARPMRSNGAKCQLCAAK